MENFEKLSARLRPRIKAIARKVGVRYTYCDPDDFFQEAMLHLWLEANKGTLRDKTDSYILQGCYFFLKNYIRCLVKAVDASSVSIDAPRDEEGSSLYDLIPATGSTTGIDSVEIFMFLDRIGEDFEDSERDIVCRKLEGYTVREIGAYMGVSHVTIVKKEKKIREKCRRIRNELFC